MKKQLDKKQSLIAAISASGAAALGITAISYCVTRAMVSLAIDRKDPKQFQKRRDALAKTKELSKIMEKQNEYAARLEEMPSEQVEITGFDGTRLLGHLYEVEGAERTLIAFHGWRSKWSTDFAMIFDFWFENRCNVLFVEQRAQKGSSGDYMGFGLLERFDCQAWAKWYADRSGGKLPVYLVGISMGAATVLMASGLSLPDCVHGIMADCGFTSPYAIWKHVVEKNLHLPYVGFRSLVIDDLCKRKLNNADYRYSTLDALKNCRVPVFLVHGTADRLVPVTMTYQNYIACPTEKRLLIVPGADHGMSYLVEPEKYQSELLAFFSEFDAKKPIPEPEEKGSTEE